MRVRHLLVFFCLLVVAQVVVAGALPAGSSREEVAASAAEQWFGMVDSGGYAQAWEEAADLIRKAVSKEDWQKTMEAFRSPLGKVLERKALSKKYTHTLPGVPDGDYVVIQYQTRFENKKTAIETVTPMLEKDGRWRVAGYYIK